ncbi:MAG: hypothetical protein ACRDYU_18025 [Actinomycetes bacterium]
MAGTQMRRDTDAGLPSAARQHLRWLAAGLALGFTVPFVFADLLDLPRDLYYAIYVASVGGFFAAWVRFTCQPVGAMLRRRWQLAVVLGLLAGGVLSVNVVRTEAETPGPDGFELAGAVLWRGVVYGVADGLLLSVFPILVVFAAAAGSRLRTHRSGLVVLGAAALVASLAMTAVYHTGYSDFRSQKLAKPVAGDVVWSIPTLVTLNPLGAPIAHAGMHVIAVLHSYETDTFLPPHELGGSPETSGP